MATLIIGISTSGLAKSPDPSNAWSRRNDNPGEYSVLVTLTNGMNFELITTPGALAGLVNRLGDTLTRIIRDHDHWEDELIELDTPHLSTTTNPNRSNPT